MYKLYHPIITVALTLCLGYQSYTSYTQSNNDISTTAQNSSNISAPPVPVPIGVTDHLPPPLKEIEGLEFSYEYYQATFLTAKSATVYATSDGVLIEAQDLKPETTQGIVLTCTGLVDPAIEVYNLLEVDGVTVGVFPPRSLRPSENGKYQITGKVGDRFGIRAVTANGAEFILLKVEGNPTDPPPTNPPPTDPPPNTDTDQLTKVVSVAVTTLNDKVTQQHIKEELEKLLADFPTEFSTAVISLKNAISEGLLASMAEVPTPYKDWANGFRAPLDNEILRLNPLTASDMKVIVEAIVKGM